MSDHARDRQTGITTLDVTRSQRSRADLLAALRARAIPVIAYFGALVVLLQFYSWFRKTYFQRPAEIAFRNALDVIEFQARIGLAVERVELPLQDWTLQHAWLIDAMNLYYRQMKPVLYVAALLCLMLAPRAFPRIWWGFVIATAIGFPMYALYPLAPPRLMGPFGYPFVDTLEVFGGVQSSSEGLGGANQYAAMPSMHICWSIFAAFWLAAALPWRRIGLALGALHVALMSFSVVVTGNHYVLDVIAGALVAGVAIVIAGRLPEYPGRALVNWIRRRATARAAPHARAG